MNERDTKESIAELHRAHGALVLRRCQTLLKDREAAADAAQEVFVRVIEKIDRFRGEASPVTWVYRIATNVCLDELRRRAKRRLVEWTPELHDALTGGLVSWQEGAAIYAARLDQNGEAIGSSPLTVASHASASATRVSVLADQNGFWVLWEKDDGGVHATRVTENGAVVASTEPLTSRGTAPAGACRKGECLVVWQGGNGLQGLRIDAAGAALNTEVIDIARATETRALAQPAVGADEGSYLVAWTSLAAGEGDIYGVRVSTEGTLVDAPGTPLAVAPGHQHAPAVTSSGEGFFVVWTDEAEHVGSYGVRIDSTGNRIDGHPLPISFGSQAQAAFGEGIYFVVGVGWTDVVGAKVDGCGRVVDVLPNGEPYTTVGHADEGTLPAVAFNGNGFLVVWGVEEYYPKTGQREILATVVNTSR